MRGGGGAGGTLGMACPVTEPLDAEGASCGFPSPATASAKIELGTTLGPGGVTDAVTGIGGTGGLTNGARVFGATGADEAEEEEDADAFAKVAFDSPFPGWLLARAAFCVSSSANAAAIA